jgi:hypothetical protein
MAAEVLSVQNATLAIIIGALGAIIYALRMLVVLERRIARIDYHIGLFVKRILKEELKIEDEEKDIMSKLNASSKGTTSSKKKKSTKKKK